MGLKMCCLKALNKCMDCCEDDAALKDQSQYVPNIIITPPTPVPTGTRLPREAD